MRQYIENCFTNNFEFVGAVSKQKCVYRNKVNSIKLIKLTLPPDTDITAYNLLVGFEHPNLSRVYDTVVLNDITVVLLEYVEGVTLAELMTIKQQNMQGVKHIAKSICNGLTALHSKNIVHRDIKPENIIVSDDGTVKIIDYSIATVFDMVKPQKTAVLGTNGFAPPEQYGLNHSNPRMDIYAFGVTLNLMLTHNHPSVELYKKGHLGKVIKKCLAVNANDRYANATQLLNAL